MPNLDIQNYWEKREIKQLHMDDSTSGNFGAHAVKGAEPYNMVAMVGGKYRISKEILLQRLQGILKTGEHFTCVFPSTRDSLHFVLWHWSPGGHFVNWRTNQMLCDKEIPSESRNYSVGSLRDKKFLKRNITFMSLKFAFLAQFCFSSQTNWMQFWQ